MMRWMGMMGQMGTYMINGTKLLHDKWTTLLVLWDGRWTRMMSWMGMAGWMGT